MIRLLLLLPMLLAASISGAQAYVIFGSTGNWRSEFEAVCTDLVDLRGRLPPRERPKVDEVFNRNHCSGVTMMQPADKDLVEMCERIRSRLLDDGLQQERKDDLAKTFNSICMENE